MGKVHHYCNGDESNGWYCYECDFYTRNVTEAAKHDFWEIARGSTICLHGSEPYDCRICFPIPTEDK